VIDSTQSYFNIGFICNADVYLEFCLLDKEEYKFWDRVAGNATCFGNCVRVEPLLRIDI